MTILDNNFENSLLSGVKNLINRFRNCVNCIFCNEINRIDHFYVTCKQKITPHTLMEACGKHKYLWEIEKKT